LNHPDEQQNFFDAKTIVAVVLVGLTFVGWQWYMQKKYPDAMAKKSQPTAVQDASPEKTGAPAVPATAATSAAAESINPAAQIAESVVSYASSTLSFEISNRGMGLKNIRVRQFNDRQGEPIELGHPEEGVLSFETRLLGSTEPLIFALEKVNDNHYVGRATLGKLKIAKTIEIRPEEYVIDYKVQVTGEDGRFVGLTTFLTEKVDLPESQSFLMPQFQVQEFYVKTADTDERFTFSTDDATKSWTRVRIAALGSQYFTQAVMDKSAILPEAKGRVNHKNHFAELALQYTVLNKGEPFTLEYKSFVGPKSHQLLSAVDENLAKVVDFGFFNMIGRQILWLLKAFFALTGNWGWSIILLTIVVRILVLPFNIYSYKSMKAMQVIQPKIQALREKYKDDQPKQQQEMMALMKENKVNPLGGCLPVFLQFPIFIALYQVLGHSVELYQAPFVLWIHDLSLKDPFYILPVLMGVTMFIQQKITPNTSMDPAQAKVLLFMPILFTFFMISLPSGLTLYMWVGAVFSVLQQMYFMRDKPRTSQGAK
jgi:YidC/Oxa1 family membrane protein insertase